MNLIEGLWCPEIMHGPHAYLRRSRSLDAQIALCPQRRTCVQAGGHIGIYPRKLSKFFECVYTFEPEPENFSCLVLNTRGMPNVLATPCFLGSDNLYRNLRKHSKSSGGHHAGEPSATGLATVTIDGYQFSDLDAMFVLCHVDNVSKE